MARLNNFDQNLHEVFPKLYSKGGGERPEYGAQSPSPPKLHFVLTRVKVCTKIDK